MNNNFGKQNEIDIINYINKCKYIHKMNNNLKKFIQEIFDFDLTGIKIAAFKYYENYKPDIIIEANNTKKYISIKFGKNNSVHQEHFYSFFVFLKEHGATEKSLEYLRFFQFNDGTLDGSGKSRKSAMDFQTTYPTAIKTINSEFNSNNLKKKLINRLLFEGEYHNLPEIDYIYYGDKNDGIWANKKEIFSHLYSINFFSNSIHVSKLYYQCLHRNLKRNNLYEMKRYYIQFKWHSIYEDLMKIKKKKQ